jgi:16S rRNA (cytosine1402-N4)-methyltransferase
MDLLKKLRGPEGKNKNKKMQKVTPKNQNKHIPVLTEQVLKYLDPKPGEKYLDLTAGYGGHAELVLERTLNAPAVLVDRDITAVDELTEKFKHKSTVVKHDDFRRATKELAKTGSRFDLILADLGVSSPHLNTAVRGFAIKKDGPLDMRMDQSQELTAAAIVNGYSESKLAEIFKRYGEEPRAHKVAREIVLNRPLYTTHELAALVARVWPGKSKVHPATRVFQALRIEVNDELKQIEQALPLWIEMLEPGGRIVVISFHSLEDRIVKQVFKETGTDTYDAALRLLTTRPVVAENDELVFNPRARSAKLRAAVKINT